MFKEHMSVIRVFEALVAFSTTFLALNSFFASSIFRFISDMFSWILEGMGFVLESSLSASSYMPVLLGVVVFVLIILEFLSGEERNTINIYQINFMLFLATISLISSQAAVLQYDRQARLNHTEKSHHPISSPAKIYIQPRWENLSGRSYRCRCRYHQLSKQ